MANLQYIGARYVPKFYLNPDYPAPDTRNNDWKSGVDYEALTIVTYNNDSYTSKMPVPDTVGNPIDNPEYWACTTKYTAALSALQNTVGLLETDFDNLINLIGDTQLKTILTTVTGAVNENFLNGKFLAQRYGSYVAPDTENYGQAIVRHNNLFYATGEIASGFMIGTFNDELELQNSYAYNIAVHPNAIFVVGAYIYVVDSTHYDIIKIKLSDMTYVETITSHEGDYIISGCSDENRIYLYGSHKLFVYNSSFVLIASLSLPSVDLPANRVLQGVFVDKGYIYLVYNRPNALIIYDFTGTLIGVKEIGTGDGYYPYGEVETLFKWNDDVYMYTGFYSVFSVGYSAIFKTNINSYIPSNSAYGQENPAANSIVFKGDAAHVRNADGSNTKPFNCAHEACSVFEYLYREYAYFKELVIKNASATDRFVLENCNCYIYLIGTAIGSVSLINGVYTLSSGTINSVYANGATLIFERTHVTDIDFSEGNLISGGATFTGEVNLTNVEILDKINKIRSNYSDITINGGNAREIAEIGDDDPITTTPHAISGIVQKIVFDRFANYPTLLKIDMIALDSNYNYAFTIDLYFWSALKSSINGGTTATKKITANIVSGSNVVKVDCTFKITKTEITLDSITATYNGSPTTTPTLTGVCYDWLNLN